VGECEVLAIAEKESSLQLAPSCYGCGACESLLRSSSRVFAPKRPLLRWEHDQGVLLKAGLLRREQVVGNTPARHSCQQPDTRKSDS
ncbi:MAG: hypothetical protein FWE48_03645, partial [Coriobacteriia bacterium]|nr:hypothetical protein [Coriobacteriia bacterium]